MSNIASMVQRLSGVREATLQICTVDAIDRYARAADCTPLGGGSPLLGCNLQACQESRHGMVLYPKVGSYVLVGILDGMDAGLVLLTDEIEELEVKIGKRTFQVTADGFAFNGGELGGLIKIEGLTERLNAIENDVNDLKRAVSSWVPVPNDGGAALKTSISSWAGKPLERSKRSDYENELIKQ